MRKYHRERVKNGNGRNESHGDDVEDGHFTENGMGNIIEYKRTVYIKMAGSGRTAKSELLVIGRKYSV
jgi:hypothetical protein